MKALSHKGKDGTISLSPELVIGGIAVVTGLFFGIRYLIRRTASNFAQDKSAYEGSEESIAKELRQGFDNDGWWGTDVPRVRHTMQSIPTQRLFKKVQDKYASLYMGENLMRRLEEELTASEYQEMISILRAKPFSLSKTDVQKANAKKIVYWAKRLNEAVNYKVGIFPGRDSDAIETVLKEIPSKGVYRILEKYYEATYGKALTSDLKGYRFWKFSGYKKIIDAKPN